MVLLEPTMIFINNEDLQNLGDKEYSSVEEIFRELFWKSSLWGSIIVQESLYDDVDWETYIQKFVGTDQISVGLHWYRLASVQNFKAFLLSVRKNSLCPETVRCPNSRTLRRCNPLRRRI